MAFCATLRLRRGPFLSVITHQPLLEFRSYYVWILVECVAPEAKRFASMDQEINSLFLHLPLDPCAA